MKYSFRTYWSEKDKLEEMREMVKESERLIEEKTKELLVVQAKNEQ